MFSSEIDRVTAKIIKLAKKHPKDNIKLTWFDSDNGDGSYSCYPNITITRSNNND